MSGRRHAPIMSAPLPNEPLQPWMKGLSPKIEKLRSKVQRITMPFLLHISNWIRLFWFDLLAMFAVLGLISLVNKLDVFRQHSRIFPMWRDSSTYAWVGPVELSYPYTPMIIGTVTCALIVLLVPIVTILIMQIFVRSFWDANAAILGVLQTMILMTFLQVVIKQYIGAYRPYFLSACNPDPAVLDALEAFSGPGPSGNKIGYNRVFATVKSCQFQPYNDPAELLHSKDFLKDAMRSYPSGHTGSAFAVGVFLALYLNAKLKAFSNHPTSFWKMMATMAPLVGAILIAGGLLIDHHHHPHDILLSIPLGVLCALFGYRAHYRSLSSYHDNHIPLRRSPPDPPFGRSALNRAVLPPVLNMDGSEYLALRRWCWPWEKQKPFLDVPLPSPENASSVPRDASQVVGGDGTQGNGEGMMIPPSEPSSYHQMDGSGDARDTEREHTRGRFRSIGRSVRQRSSGNRSTKGYGELVDRRVVNGRVLSITRTHGGEIQPCADGGEGVQAGDVPQRQVPVIKVNGVFVPDEYDELDAQLIDEAILSNVNPDGIGPAGDEMV